MGRQRRLASWCPHLMVNRSVFAEENLLRLILVKPSAILSVRLTFVPDVVSLGRRCCLGLLDGLIERWPVRD